MRRRRNFLDVEDSIFHILIYFSDENATVDSINKRNEIFNKKIKRAFNNTNVAP